MMMSAYLSLLDDWDILATAIRSIIDRVDEIVVVDGAYTWMTPYFKKINRDPAFSLPQVYKILSEFGSKIHILNGIWENELEKRVAGFNACKGRYRFRIDADEIYFFDEMRLQEFFKSNYAVAEVEIPVYVSPGLIGGTIGKTLPRLSFLFDANRISATDHVGYLWLVLPDWERAICGKPIHDYIFLKPVAFAAHLTHWRTPASALTRARFYVLNYMRQHGTESSEVKSCPDDQAPFTAYFERQPPAIFDEILLGRSMVVTPGSDQMTGYRTPLSFDQEQTFCGLYEVYLQSLATLNYHLLGNWRSILPEEAYHLDATLEFSLPVGLDGVLCFEFSEPLKAVAINLSIFNVPCARETVELDSRVLGTYLLVQIPNLPPVESFLRRTLTLTVWPATNVGICRFRFVPLTKKDQVSKANVGSTAAITLDKNIQSGSVEGDAGAVPHGPQIQTSVSNKTVKRAMPRSMVIVGDSLSLPLADALALGATGIETDFIDVNFPHLPEMAAKIAALAPRGDQLVFSVNLSTQFGALATEPLRQHLGDQLVTFTNIHFSGLHPDITYLGPMGRRTPGYFEDYHSKLVLFAYVTGRSVADCIALFTGAHYERIGYFAEFAASAAELMRRDEACNVRYAGMFIEQIKQVPGLFTINHPTGPIFMTLANVLARVAGVPFERFDALFLENPLARNVIWPVYNEIAEHHGLRYRMPQLFVAPVRRAARGAALAEFVAGSYAAYAQADANEFFAMVRQLPFFAQFERAL